MTVDWFRNFLEHAEFWPPPNICFTGRIATVATRGEIFSSCSPHSVSMNVSAITAGQVLRVQQIQKYHRPTDQQTGLLGWMLETLTCLKIWVQLGTRLMPPLWNVGSLFLVITQGHWYNSITVLCYNQLQSSNCRVFFPESSSLGHISFSVAMCQSLALISKQGTIKYWIYDVNAVTCLNQWN